MTRIIVPAPLPRVLDGADQSMDPLSLVLGFLQQGKHHCNTVYISMTTAPCLTEKYTPTEDYPLPLKKSKLSTECNFRY